MKSKEVKWCNNCKHHNKSTCVIPEKEHRIFGKRFKMPRVDGEGRLYCENFNKDNQ